MDFDVGDRVSFDIVRVEAVAARGKVHWRRGSAQDASAYGDTRRTVLQGQGGILRVDGRDHAVDERVWRVLQSHGDRDTDEARRHACWSEPKTSWNDRGGGLGVLAWTTSPELDGVEVWSCVEQDVRRHCTFSCRD